VQKHMQLACSKRVDMRRPPPHSWCISMANSITCCRQNDMNSALERSALRRARALRRAQGGFGGQQTGGGPSNGAHRLALTRMQTHKATGHAFGAGMHPVLAGPSEAQRTRAAAPLPSALPVRPADRR
jgi:hypothetical protein